MLYYYSRIMQISLFSFGTVGLQRVLAILKEGNTGISRLCQLT